MFWKFHQNWFLIEKVTEPDRFQEKARKQIFPSKFVKISKKEARVRFIGNNHSFFLD